MPSAPLPPHEAHRLAAQRELGDDEADGSLEALVRSAARLTGSPLALITRVDDQRQWFQAAHGLAPSEASRALAFCTHVLHGDSLLEVPDTLADARFAAHPMLLGDSPIRFCAGVPLDGRDEAPGTLCVLDTRPRTLSDTERDALQDLSRVAAGVLRGRRRMSALDDEHRRLLDFGRASGDWMWETDAELRTTWVSAEFERVTGTPAHSVIGQLVPDLTLLDATGQVRAQGERLIDVMRREQPFSRAVGEEPSARGLMAISRSAVPVFDAHGRFGGYRGTSRDVTAQVEAARRARGHDVLLRKLSSQVPGVIFQFKMAADGHFSYPYASDGLREMFGVADGEVVRGDATVPLRALHPDDRPGFVDSIKASARQLHAWQREYRIARGDGSIRWLETRATPERLPDGGTLWHGFTADITERKETELALRRSEERWEMAADAAGIGIAEADLTTGLISMDRRACLNHGLPYPLPDYTLQQWLQAIDASCRDAAQSGLQHALDSRSTLETRYLLHRPDGSQVTLEITARGCYGDQGQPIGLVGTCRDVTAQLAVDRLQRDKETAERANRAKSEFLSRVSHELRTPLNGILGFAQLMSLDRVDTLAPAQQRRLDSVVRAGHHLLGLINDVLDLTRIESDDFTLQPCGVNTCVALADCIALIQPLANEASVHLPALPLAAAPAWVHADPRALEQVLMNLLSNAIKYNRPAGAVRIEIDAERKAGRVCIAISDQGRGMNEQQRANLFQPFNRLGAEHSRTEGSGLGLVICRRLVDAMGGRLDVASRPGVGSTFSIELPASRAVDEVSPAPTLSQAPLPTPRTGPREVLYIEDEPLNMVLMEEVFRTQPEWTLLVAEDGATGARIARDARPDLVLIDMNLPDTDGLALIRRLRSDPSTRPLRCIALSADAMREQIDAALAAGFDDYWTKPIDVRRVLGDLGRLLAQPRVEERVG